MNIFTLKKPQHKQWLSSLMLSFTLSSTAIAFAQPNENPLQKMNGEENIQKRDMFSRHFANDKGGYSAILGTSPMNYEKDGSYHMISTSVKNNDDSNYPYANTENLMESHFGSTSSLGIKNRIQGKTIYEFLNTTMHWETNGQFVATVEQADSPVNAINNKVTYHNIFGEIDAEFKITNGKRKLNFIIPSHNAIANAPVGADYLVFSEEILLPETWTYNTTEKGIFVYDDKNNTVLLYESPYSVDSGKKVLREKNTFIDVIPNGNRLTVLTKVKADWLLDQARTFPVLIDPTVTAYPNEVEFHTGCVYSSDGYKVDSFIGFGRDVDNQGVEDFLRGWARFNTTSIPDDATINAGTTIHFYIEDGSPDYSPANGHSMVISQIPSSINPVTANGATLYNTINQNGYSPVITAPLNSIGWKSHTITSGQIALDIQNQLAQNYFSVGFMPQGNFFEGEYIIASGWDTDEKPYLVINYTESNMSVNDVAKSIGLYPNPVQSELFIQSDYAVQSLEVFSVLGQSVAKSNGSNSIVVSSLSNGIYAIQVTLDNGTVVNQKFIKK